MRPIFSPTDFIQIKGRGTRKNTFTFELLYLTNDDEERYSIQAEIAHIILILGMLCTAAEGQELPES